MKMEEDNKQDVLVMALLVVTKDVVLDCADELGMSEDQLTEEMTDKIKNDVSKALGDWRGAVKDVVKSTIRQEIAEKDTAECPLGLTCSAACPFRQIGGCRLPKKVG